MFTVKRKTLHSRHNSIGEAKQFTIYLNNQMHINSITLIENVQGLTLEV